MCPKDVPDVPFDFEEALETLEGLVNAMEAGDLSLEDSLRAFEQGIRLTRECQSALEKAEQKVQLLIQEGEEPQARDFGPGEKLE